MDDDQEMDDNMNGEEGMEEEMDPNGEDMDDEEDQIQDDG